MKRLKRISPYQLGAGLCLAAAIVLGGLGLNAYLTDSASDAGNSQSTSTSTTQTITPQADYTPVTGYEKLLETRTITANHNGRDSHYFAFTPADLEGKELRVTFTGDTPRLQFVQIGEVGDNKNTWLYWAIVEPDHVDTSNNTAHVAYFSAAHVAAKWASDAVVLSENKTSETDATPIVAQGDYTRFYLYAPVDNGEAVITRLALVGGAAPTHPTQTAVSGLTGTEIVQNMRIGWNLGNTLDAYYKKDDMSQREPDRGEREMETAWSNPVTTAEHFAFVKEQGFNAVRIPVSWFQHVYQQGSEKYHIDEAWMQRVHEVVDAAYDQGLYVILNTHHERLYIEAADFGDASKRAEKVAYLSSIWHQIATEFKDYDQRLVFEGLNEPRATYEDADSQTVKDSVSHDREWGTPTDDDMATLNALNQAFVDAVRSVESTYRTTRLLIVPMMSGSTNTNISARLVLPKTGGATDPYVGVSAHPYQPYWFTSADAGTYADYDFTGSALNRNHLESVLYGMYAAFTSKGVPVVLDETGASDMYNADSRPEHTEQREAWAKEIVSLARGWGMTCFLWDNGASTTNSAGNPQGYINRWSTPVSFMNERQEAVAKALAAATTGSEAVAWGSTKNTPVPSGSATGKQLNAATESLSANGGTSERYAVIWSDISEGAVAVEFTGAVLGDSPNLVMRDSNAEYVEMEPSYVAWNNTATSGTAYFWPEHIDRAWLNAKKQETTHTHANLAYLQVKSAKGCSVTRVVLTGDTAEPSTHAELASANNLIAADLTLKDDAANNTAFRSSPINLTWADMNGHEIAVKYTGTEPRIGLVQITGSTWDNSVWDIAPTSVDADAGVAYFSSRTVRLAWEGLKATKSGVGDFTGFIVQTQQTNAKTNETTVSKISLLELPAGSHDWGDWVADSTTAATCTAAGSHKRHCYLHNEDEDIAIPALGHSDNGGVVTQAATATQDGLITHNCIVCGQVLRTEAIPKLNVSANESGSGSGSGTTDGGDTGDATDGTNTEGYQILHRDNNGVWVQGSGVPFVFSSSAELSKFVCVLVDGSVLGSSHYTVHSGSTVVSLRSDYLATLSVGEHTATVRSSDGDAYTTFTVQAAGTSGGSDSGSGSGSGGTGGTTPDSEGSEPDYSAGPSGEDSGTSGTTTPAGPWEQGGTGGTTTTTTTTPTTTTTVSTTTNSGTAATGTQSAGTTQVVSTVSGTTQAAGIPQTGDNTPQAATLLVASAFLLGLCLVIKLAEER